MKLWSTIHNVKNYKVNFQNYVIYKYYHKAIRLLIIKIIYGFSNYYYVSNIILIRIIYYGFNNILFYLIIIILL
jgi:hypothetical protein